MRAQLGRNVTAHIAGQSAYTHNHYTLGKEGVVAVVNSVGEHRGSVAGVVAPRGDAHVAALMSASLSRCVRSLVHHARTKRGCVETSGEINVHDDENGRDNHALHAAPEDGVSNDGQCLVNDHVR